jgi:hypothetical protein
VSACWVWKMLAKEHKQKNGRFTWKSLPLSKWSYQIFFQEKDLRTKMRFKKQLCNTSHPLERKITVNKCDKYLNANSDYVEIVFLVFVQDIFAINMLM